MMKLFSDIQNSQRKLNNIEQRINERLSQMNDYTPQIKKVIEKRLENMNGHELFECDRLDRQKVFDDMVDHTDFPSVHDDIILEQIDQVLDSHWFEGAVEMEQESKYEARTDKHFLHGVNKSQFLSH